MSTSVFISDKKLPFNYYNFDEIYPRIVSIIVDQECDKPFTMLPSPQPNEKEINYTFESMINEGTDIAVIKCGYNGSYCIYLVNYFHSYYIVPFSPTKYFKIDKFNKEEIIISDDSDVNDDLTVTEDQELIESDTNENSSILHKCYKALIKKCSSLFN